jgi:hypothetical protein
MVDLEPTPYGFRMSMSAQVTEAEMQAFMEKMKRLVTGERRFGLLVDARAQKAQQPQVAAQVQECMRWMMAHGQDRSAVLLDSALARLQTARMARESGLDKERILYGSSDPRWEAAALAWIERGEEPPSSL